MRKFTLLLFFVVLWSFSYAQMGEEQYFVDIHGDLRYESRISSGIRFTRIIGETR